MQRLGAGDQFRLEPVTATLEYADDGPVGAAQGDPAAEVEPAKLALSGAADDQLPNRGHERAALDDSKLRANLQEFGA